jgi:hypothetical protein
MRRRGARVDGRLRAMRIAGAALAACIAALALVQTGAARPSKMLEIKHHFRGCHVFATNEKPVVNVRLRKGDRIQVVDHDPMDFDVVQTAGPRVPLGDPRLRRSETRLLVFRKSGLYRFEATNVQTSEELGLQTLGPDNTLRITVRIP